MRRLFRIRCSHVRAQAGGVSIQVDNTSWNSRRIYASISITAPVEMVWNALTDYDNLDSFIPSLVENRCLERNGTTAVLYQVGAQDVAMGVKFSAACTLKCEEFLDGVPEALLSADAADMESRFPVPSSSSNGCACRDITFALVEGDFKSFRGVWRMQPQPGGGPGTILSYALYVKPQSWLPVTIIQGRIEREVTRNLEAVCKHAEACHVDREHSPSPSQQLNAA